MAGRAMHPAMVSKIMKEHIFAISTGRSIQTTGIRWQPTLVRWQPTTSGTAALLSLHWEGNPQLVVLRHSD